jgi:hypothetical protein
MNASSPAKGAPDAWQWEKWANPAVILESFSFLLLFIFLPTEFDGRRKIKRMRKGKEGQYRRCEAG